MKGTNAPSKYLFYNDPFLGLLDHRIAGSENKYYSEILRKLNEFDVAEEYILIFDYAKALCDVLSTKSELGVCTRQAYLNGNKTLLREIAEVAYNRTIDKIKVFHKVYQTWWMSENKPYGFEMQDIRMGGLIQRLRSCKKRILAYCDGDIDNIPELEESVLSDDCGCSWARIVTPGVISHSV